MKKKTISGLPNPQIKYPIEFRELICTPTQHYFDKFAFIQAYTYYKAYKTLQPAGCSVSEVETALVLYKGNPLMYGFTHLDGNSYIIAEIGGTQIFAVPRSAIEISLVKNYRIRFISVIEGDAIAELTPKGRISALFIQKDDGREHEIKKFLIPITPLKAVNWLEKHGF